MISGRFHPDDPRAALNFMRIPGSSKALKIKVWQVHHLVLIFDRDHFSYLILLRAFLFQVALILVSSDSAGIPISSSQGGSAGFITP
jgi:hypothetical protein